jgi:hypothetical protein
VIFNARGLFSVVSCPLSSMAVAGLERVMKSTDAERGEAKLRRAARLAFIFAQSGVPAEEIIQINFVLEPRQRADKSFCEA